MPPVAINHRWSFAHCSHLTSVSWPQSTLLKKYFLFVPNSRSKAVTQQLYCFRKVILTQNVDCQKSAFFFFFWLIKADLAKAPRSADKHNTQSLCGADVSPARRRGKVNVGGQQPHYLGLSVMSPVGPNEMRKKTATGLKDNTLAGATSPLQFDQSPAQRQFF